MQKLKSIKKVLAAVVLLSILWVLFFFTQLFCLKPQNNNNLFIPENATFAIRMDGKSIAEHTFFSVFLEAQDEKSLRKLRSSLAELRTKELKDVGIDFLSDMIFFSTPYKNGNLFGISLNLTKPKEFTKNCPDIFGKNQFVDVHENVGLILLYKPDNSAHKVSQKELLSYLHNQISTKNPFVADHQKEKVIQLYTKEPVSGNSSYFSASNLFFEIRQSGIDMDGNLYISNKNAAKEGEKTYFLTADKNAFHFSTAIISTSIQDSLENILGSMGLNIPKIQAISFNYKGMEIVNNETGMHTLPKINLVLKFKEPAAINTLLNNPELLNKLDAQFENNELTIGKQTYYLQQLDQHTIFLGVDKHPVISDHPPIIAVKGNLPSLLKIEGGGIITSFLEIVPIYRASKELFNNTKNFEIVIQKTNKNKAKIKGNITFKKDHYAMNEFLKFLLEGKASFN